MRQLTRLIVTTVALTGMSYPARAEEYRTLERWAVTFVNEEPDDGLNSCELTPQLAAADIAIHLLKSEDTIVLSVRPAWRRGANQALALITEMGLWFDGGQTRHFPAVFSDSTATVDASFSADLFLSQFAASSLMFVSIGDIGVIGVNLEGSSEAATALVECQESFRIFPVANCLETSDATNFRCNLGKVSYGGRVGMEATVTGQKGIDTEQAVIFLDHNREDAITFCSEYVGNVTEECIANELAIGVTNSISANCETGKFSTPLGQNLMFIRNGEEGNEVTLIDLDAGGSLGPSMASGYYTALDIFERLCPAKAAPR